MNEEPSREDRITLELLDAIERRSDVSQRHLARQMGVALGLANSYLRRCARKGLIKISSAPANRYLYYLTPNGFAEKARLTTRYLSTSLEFYRQAGRSCDGVFAACNRDGVRRLLLCGRSDLAEIAFLRAMDGGPEIVGVFDPATHRGRFFSRPVWSRLTDAAPFDGCMITALSEPAQLRRSVTAQTDARVYVPDILRLEQ